MDKLSDHPDFKPTLERNVETWRLARQAWDALSDLDEMTDESATLGAALDEIYAIQVRAMQPLIELGVFPPSGVDEMQVMQAETKRQVSGSSLPRSGDGA